MARRKAQTYGSCLAARGRFSARQSRRLRHRAPALVRPATLERADLSFSQLLTGTPSGPGGAPIPPERSCCVHEPAGAAPRPAPWMPHDRALQVDEVLRWYGKFRERG